LERSKWLHLGCLFLFFSYQEHHHTIIRLTQHREHDKNLIYLTKINHPSLNKTQIRKQKKKIKREQGKLTSFTCEATRTMTCTQAKAGLSQREINNLQSRRYQNRETY
jgi:hypothetical protein